MFSSVVRAASSSMAHRRTSFVSFYTTVAGLTRTNWNTGAYPAPTPLTTDDTDADALAHDDHEQPSRPRPRSPRPFAQKTYNKPTPAEHTAHRAAMKRAFPEGWAPPRKLSRDAMDALRALHAADPETFPTAVLADKFRVSAEAVRRILKSKWTPTREQRIRMVHRENEAKERWVQERRREERGKMQEEGRSTRPVGVKKGDKLSLT